jgi:acyl-CoA synthetase (AMP-forming)/AMP-acid ligase II
MNCNLAGPFYENTVQTPDATALVIGGQAFSYFEPGRGVKTRLPSFTVPAGIRRADRIPLAPSGKFDRRALAAMLECAG